MQPEMYYYANHKINFSDIDIDELRYNVITELRKHPVPVAIKEIVLGNLRKQFGDTDLSKFTDHDNWTPVQFPGVSEKQQKALQENRILTFGPLGIRLVVTPGFMILPSFFSYIEDWYSPSNKEKVSNIRQFYRQLTFLFGGDHALYADEKTIDEFDFPKSRDNPSVLIDFEKSLIKRYGIPEKSFSEYNSTEYPKFYIDNFDDLPKIFAVL